MPDTPPSEIDAVKARLRKAASSYGQGAPLAPFSGCYATFGDLRTLLASNDRLSAEVEQMHGDVGDYQDGWHKQRDATRSAEAERDAARAALELAKEAAWRDGWLECKNRLTDDEAFCLTEDVEEDAWLDSATRSLSLIAQPGGGAPA